MDLQERKLQIIPIPDPDWPLRSSGALGCSPWQDKNVLLFLVSTNFHCYYFLFATTCITFQIHRPIVFVIAHLYINSCWSWSLQNHANELQHHIDIHCWPHTSPIKTLFSSLKFYLEGYTSLMLVSLFLPGAHTLGRGHGPSASGYVGPWTDRRLALDNSYYKDLISAEKGWAQVCMMSRTRSWAFNWGLYSPILWAHFVWYSKFTQGNISVHRKM